MYNYIYILIIVIIYNFVNLILIHYGLLKLYQINKKG